MRALEDVTEADVTDIFANLPMLLTFNRKILLDLEEPALAPGESLAARVGGVFFKSAAFFRMYEAFVNAQEHGTREAEARLRVHLAHCRLIH